MLGGGGERDWLIPLDPQGNKSMEADGIFENTVGCHTGLFAGLNIINPQPGYEYQWMLNPSRMGADVSDSLAIHELGGIVVVADDPEFAAYQKMQGMDASPLDTSTVFKELVLVRVPEARMRQRREAQVEANLRQLRGGPEESFVSKASAEEIQAGQGAPTRFRSRRHQTEFQEGGQTRELSVPDTGIVRTDDVTPKNLG